MKRSIIQMASELPGILARPPGGAGQLTRAIAALDGTNSLRHRMVRDGTVEHAAYRNPVDRSVLHAEADKAPREDIDHDHNPVTTQEDGFAAEQVNTPQAVLGPGEKGQPGWAIGSRGPRLVMFGEDATPHVLVEFDTERMANLLGNPQMAEIRVLDFISTIAAIRSAAGPFGPGFRQGGEDENSRRYL